jgi:hypothetical protein
MALAMQQAGVTPRELSLALGIDPNEGINRYNAALEQDPLSNPLTVSNNSTGNPLLSTTANVIGSSLANPEFLTSTMGERVAPGLKSGILNFAAADDASGRKNAALDALISIIGGPGGQIFKAFLDQFGFFKGGGSKAVNLTPEQQVEEAYKIFQDQQLATQGTEGQDARLMGMIADADRIGLDTTDLRAQLKNEFGITSVPGDLPEGYVRDSQGFIRDVATEGYWTIGSDGEPTRRPVPLVNVPMPSVDSGGGATVSTSGATPSSSTGATVSEGVSSTGAGEWVYDSKAGIFRQTGGIETIVPKEGTYTDGQVVSSKDMKDVFGNWGRTETTADSTTPTDWASIFNTRGVGDVIAEMARLKKTSDDVAKESGFSTAQIDQAIADYNNQVAAGPGVIPGPSVGDTGAGGAGTPGFTGVATPSTIIGPGTTPDGGAGPVSVTPTTTPPVTPPVTPGTGPGTGPGIGPGTGTGTGTGNAGLITSLVNSTPISSELFKPELFKVAAKTKGLFDMVMRTRA